MEIRRMRDWYLGFRNYNMPFICLRGIYDDPVYGERDWATSPICNVDRRDGYALITTYNNVYKVEYSEHSPTMLDEELLVRYGLDDVVGVKYPDHADIEISPSCELSVRGLVQITSGDSTRDANLEILHHFLTFDTVLLVLPAEDVVEYRIHNETATALCVISRGAIYVIPPFETVAYGDDDYVVFKSRGDNWEPLPQDPTV